MGRLNIVLKSEVPAPPYDYDVTCFPIQAVPLALIALRIHQSKYWYKTPEDWKRGQSLLSQLESALLMPCGQDIINAVDRVATRLDAAFFAQYHTFTGDGSDVDPFVYTPALLQAPEEPATPPAGMVVNSQQTKELVHNLVDGTGTSLTLENRNIRDLLQQVIDNVASGAFDDTEIVEKLVEIAVLL